MVFSQILAPMTQVKGLTDGWLFDPDDLSLLIGNEATIKAFTILSELGRYTWKGAEPAVWRVIQMTSVDKFESHIVIAANLSLHCCV